MSNLSGNLMVIERDHVWVDHGRFTTVVINGCTFRRWSDDEIAGWSRRKRLWSRYAFLRRLGRPGWRIARLLGMPALDPPDRYLQLSNCVFDNGGTPESTNLTVRAKGDAQDG